MGVWKLIEKMKVKNKPLFSNMFGDPNTRANFTLIKLAKISALAYGRDYILATDLADFIKYVYMHRIDQLVASITNEEVRNQFDDVSEQVKTMVKK
jgi:hypothetical protein